MNDFTLIKDDILFCSLGMFIIDTIRFENGTELDNVIGGAGTFAVSISEQHI